MNIIKNKFLLFVAFLATIAVVSHRLDYEKMKQMAVIADKSPVAIPNPATEASATKTTAATQNDNKNLVPVLRVIDGDTIVAEVNSQPIHIRLIGINSPELNDKRPRVACLAQKAKEEAQKILDGNNIYLEKDPTQGDYDKYNRLLAYVFTENGTNFDKLMIDEGYAYEYTYNLPYKYQKEFKAAQSEARTAQKGLWNPGACK